MNCLPYKLRFVKCDDVIDCAHKSNIAVQYRTINSEKEILTLERNRADCITTDYPRMAYEAVNNH